MKSSEPLAVIAGVEAGLGFTLAKKSAKENMTVALIARNKGQLQSTVLEIEATGGKAYAFRADMTKQEEIIAAFKEIHLKLGITNILIYNAASKFELNNICDIQTNDFMNNWKVSCLGALLSLQQVLPDILKQESGTIIFTGATAATHGAINTAAFGVGKFSQRALAQSMARELESFLNPETIAETYWQLSQQHPTVWTHELDLGSSIEKF